MKNLQTISQSLLTLALAFAIAAGAWWLVTHQPATKTGEKPPSPAQVNKVVKEEDLLSVTLTEVAEKRIGLTLGKIEKKSARRVRVYGGEVMIPIGRSVLVTAPLSGILKTAGSLKAGQAVKKGDPIFQLMPLLTPEGQANLTASLADAEGQVNNAKTQVELTRIALDRAKKVLNEGAGSKRLVDEAEAAHKLAGKTLDAVSARFSILKKVVGNIDTNASAPLPLDSPQNGILRNVSALGSQTVPAGASLFEVMDLSTIWIRVPLPVGDAETIEPKEKVQVGSLSFQAQAKLNTAHPIAAPPSANPLWATIDLYYEMANEEGKFSPGQRLAVTIPLTDAKESLTVPWSAIVFDINGGTWIYEEVGPRQYSRRRVGVAYTSGSDAVLSSGPPEGTKVVSAGVQQLFGSATGFVK